MAEDELADPGPFGHLADLGDIGVQRGHPGHLELVHAVLAEVAEVRDRMQPTSRTVAAGLADYEAR